MLVRWDRNRPMKEIRFWRSQLLVRLQVTYCEEATAGRFWGLDRYLPNAIIGRGKWRMESDWN